MDHLVTVHTHQLALPPNPLYLLRFVQQVRGMCMLPHGTGKTLRICVFAKGADVEIARAEGTYVSGV